MAERHNLENGSPPSDRAGRIKMKDYMEKQLTELHYQNSGFKFREKLYAVFFGVLVIVLLPYIHIGRYENPGPGVSYKHIYFNATAATFKIWIVTVIFIVVFYESVKYLVSLFQRGPIRWSMFFLYIVNLYPHYYSWWSFFSYYNEEFHQYFKHHLFFAVTEILVTIIVLSLCNAENGIPSWKISAIVTINLIHIFVSSLDQFIGHVFHGQGTAFQNARNWGLMVPDVLHVIIPMVVFLRWAKKNSIPFTELFYKEELLLCLVLTTLGTVMGRVL